MQRQICKKALGGSIWFFVFTQVLDLCFDFRFFAFCFARGLARVHLAQVLGYDAPGLGGLGFEHEQPTVVT